MATPQELKVAVHAALDNALENGYSDECFRHPAIQTAFDLTQHDADLESYEDHELEPHVVSWRALHAGRAT